jgi:hypothetical protein
VRLASIGHWIDEIWEGDAGTQNRKPGDLLVVVAHRSAGDMLTERNFPSGDGEDCAKAPACAAFGL